MDKCLGVRTIHSLVKMTTRDSLTAPLRIIVFSIAALLLVWNRTVAAFVAKRGSSTQRGLHRSFSGRSGMSGSCRFQMSQDMAEETEVMLCFDIGSTNIKCDAYLFSWPLKRLDDISAEYSHKPFFDGLADAADMIQRTDDLMHSVISSMRNKGKYKVRSIGFCSLAMNLYGISKEGHTITPCFTYASHQETAQQVEKKLRKVVGESEHRRTGAVVHASYAVVQLKTFAEAQRKREASKQPPEAVVTTTFQSASNQRLVEDTTFAAVAVEEPSVATVTVTDTDQRVFKWQTIAAGVMARWAGRTHMPISYSEASWTGMLDFRKNKWDPFLVELSEVEPSALPELVDITHPIPNAFSKETQARWPEIRDAALYPSVGDGAAAALGSRCDESPGRIALTIGTSCAARVVVPCTDVLLPPDALFSSVVDSESGKPLTTETCALPPPGLWCYRVDQSRVLVGGALTDGGALIKWLDRLIGPAALKDAQAQLEANLLARNVTMFAASPQTLPFFSGERSTGWHTEAQGSIHGLTLDTSSVHILYSIYEGVALRIAKVVVPLV